MNYMHKKLKKGKGNLLSNPKLRWNPVNKGLTKGINRNHIAVDLSKTLNIDWIKK